MDIKKEFYITMLGFESAEFELLNRGLHLSKSRSRQYVMLDEQSEQKADIVIADIDYIMVHPITDKSQALVFVHGKDNLIVPDNNMPYTIERPLQIPKVFSVFDHITVDVLGFVPELSVGAIPEKGSDVLHKESDTLQSIISSSIPALNNKKPISVLVVDDSVIIREQMKMILHALGCLVECCSSGEEAVSVTQEEHFDIIFMDIVMPGMDGFAACKKIKHNSPVHENIVMLTSENSSLSHIKGRFAGANAYMTKPVTAEALSKQLALLAD